MLFILVADYSWNASVCAARAGYFSTQSRYLWCLYMCMELTVCTLYSNARSVLIFPPLHVETATVWPNLSYMHCESETMMEKRSFLPILLVFIQYDEPVSIFVHYNDNNSNTNSKPLNCGFYCCQKWLKIFNWIFLYISIALSIDTIE